ncbi:hypothetical protein [Neotabrizicola shimadae]|uniref:Uncharacterized protein n=1 Tax=Neotabrizicola shimadae TaxID=2807096 RepID=A0A8G1EDA7_9RHOB|nr:hypothetical protein [Neotabrizicola shimadae]QYZ69209.1 hypothetical protein JO391_15920 [Neotabrizicola shimadae]
MKDTLPFPDAFAVLVLASVSILLTPVLFRAVGRRSGTEPATAPPSDGTTQTEAAQGGNSLRRRDTHLSRFRQTVWKD